MYYVRPEQHFPFMKQNPPLLLMKVINIKNTGVQHKVVAVVPDLPRHASG